MINTDYQAMAQLEYARLKGMSNRAVDIATSRNKPVNNTVMPTKESEPSAEQDLIK